MPVTDEILNQLIYGNPNDISDELQRKMEKSLKNASKTFDNIRLNTESKSIYSRKNKPAPDVNDGSISKYFTDIKSLINDDNKVTQEFGGMLNILYEKNKKYFSLIKDYETMPILVPQINRVIMFLVNECISPDVQNSNNFVLKVTECQDAKEIQAEINKIRTEYRLDTLLREVWNNRLILGREYYITHDYNESFDNFQKILEKQTLNENIAHMDPTDYIDTIKDTLTIKINDLDFHINENVINSKQDLKFDDLNIIIEKSSLVSDLDSVKEQYLAESISNKYSASNIMNNIINCDGIINEDFSMTSDTPIDRERLDSIVKKLKSKKLRRGSIERLDPARTFKLEVGGKVILYLYITNIDETNTDRNLINFAQSLKDRLLKSKMANINSDAIDAKELITKTLATRIINSFDPSINVSRMEDIDLLHDFIINNEIYKGNKKITVYYPDEIYDMSRPNESILTNAVFFTKLYIMLMLNNVQTKILRGRGRQIHTVNLGISTNARRYLEYAMQALTSPESNLGTLNGSFEQLLNPLYSSPDIVIPAEDGGQQFIQTDYIEGQNVDMDDEFLKWIVSSIITTFGLDAAVLDATNGNLQFASTLSMESAQISNLIRCDQLDLLPEWERMILKILEIAGSDNLRNAIVNNVIYVDFYTPKSNIVKTTTDELNNSKNYADTLADSIPELNTDSEDVQDIRTQFVNIVVRDKTNVDWQFVDDALDRAKSQAKMIKAKKDAHELSQSAVDNMEEKDYDDITEEDLLDDEESGISGGEGGMPPMEDIVGGDNSENTAQQGKTSNNPFDQADADNEANTGNDSEEDIPSNMDNHGPDADNDFGTPDFGKFPEI